MVRQAVICQERMGGNMPAMFRGIQAELKTLPRGARYVACGVITAIVSKHRIIISTVSGRREVK